MFKKSTLKTLLPAAMLVASTSAFALDNEVTLANGNKAKWADVVTALNGDGANLDALQQAVTTAQNKLDRIEPKTETTVDKNLKTQQTAATAFLAAYNAYYNDDVNSNLTIWVKESTNKDEEISLTVAFTQVTDYKVYSIAEFFDSYTKKTPTKTVNALYVYTGVTGNLTYQISDYTEAQQRNIVSLAANTLTNTLPTLASFQTTGPTEKYTEAQTALETAEKALTDAQDAQKAYNTIELEGNVTAETAIKNYAGTIIGNGYAFTAPANGAVITKFTGELSSAAVNGTFATSSNGASFDNVALWNKNNNAGTYYNGNGVATEYTTLGELAYAGRTLFGVESGVLAGVTDANKVYSVEVYTTTPSEQPTQNYVTVAAGKFTNVNNNAAVTPKTNAFVKSATADLVDVEGVTNVFFGSNASAVVIEDGAAFYCPENVTAKSVTYNHNFAAGKSVTCLPFALTSENLGGAKLATFDELSGTDLYFTVVAEGVDAYVPVLIEAEAAVNGLTLGETAIAATTAQIVEGTSKGSGMSYGVLKSATASEILSDLKKDQVIGFNKTNGKFQVGGPNAKFSPFNMAIALDEAPAAEAPLNIIIKGDESAVEDVATDVEGLEVVGGNGEIVINASSELGTVAVYTLDGKVAANADVVAGANTVNVAKGVYVVMGKKVLVK